MLNPVPTKLQFARNVTSVVDNYAGPDGEIVIDSSRHEIRLQDGKTKGGFRFPSLTQLRRLFLSVDSEFGKVGFADELRGILVRVSTKTWKLRSLVAGEGITINTTDGVAGDIIFAVKERLAAVPTTRVINCNFIKESGDYIVDSAAANLPAGLQAGNAMLSVSAGIGNDATLLVVQRIISVSTDTNTIFTRRFRAEAWTNWS